jgi:dihydroflavonol-4-reductase
MKIAITGGSGHLGTVLIPKLAALGHQIRVLVYNNQRVVTDIPLEEVHGDTTQIADVERLIEGVDVVIHLAALIGIYGDRNGLVQKINVGGTKNVVDTCVAKKVKKLIHVSSIHAYKPYPHEEVLDETRPYIEKDGYAYDFSKATAQQYVLDAAKNRGLDAVVLNPTGIMGPSDYLKSPRFDVLYKFYAGLMPMVPPGGFNWVDNRDVADTIIAAIERSRKGEAYIVAGEFYTNKQLSSTIGKVLNKKTTQIGIPYALLHFASYFLEAWANLTKTEPLFSRQSIAYLVEGHPNVSSEKAARELGHKCRPLEETLKDAYAWMKAENFIK